MSPLLACSVDNHNQFSMQFHASDQCSAQSIIMLCHNVKHCTVKPWLYVPYMLHLLTFYTLLYTPSQISIRTMFAGFYTSPDFTPFLVVPHKTVISGVYHVCNILVLLPCSQLQYSVQVLPELPWSMTRCIYTRCDQEVLRLVHELC